MKISLLRKVKSFRGHGATASHLSKLKRLARKARKIKSKIAAKGQIKTISKAIDFRSASSVESSLKKLKFTKKHVAPVLKRVLKASPSKALKLSKTIIQRTKGKGKIQQGARALIKWASKAGSQERQLISTAFRKAKLSSAFLQGIAKLKNVDARAFMNDYFVAQAKMPFVLNLLKIVGRISKKYMKYIKLLVKLLARKR